MASKKLYMESIEAGYLRDFSAEVIAVEDNSVTLDRTLFYPIGGGQNWDTGTISWDGGKVAVTEVRGRGAVQHFIGEDHGIEVGDEVEESFHLFSLACLTSSIKASASRTTRGFLRFFFMTNRGSCFPQLASACS